MSIAESEVLRATGAPCYPQTTGFPSWHHLKFPRRMGGPLHSGCTGKVAMVVVVAGMQKHVTTMCLISRRIQWLQDVHCSPHSSSQGAPLLKPFKDSNQQVTTSSSATLPSSLPAPVATWRSRSWKPSETLAPGR